MKRTIVIHLIAFFTSLPIMLTAISASAGDAQLDICGQVSDAELKTLYRKPLVAKSYPGECLWSLKPDGMAYLHIAVREDQRPLRDYYNKNLSARVKLEKIPDIGDEGLMSISEGSLGVIVIRKGDMVIKSAATFLDIEPGSKKQEALFGIYRRIADQL